MKQLLGILLAVAVCFGANLPAQAQNTKDIVDRLNTSLGISLPSQYQTTVENFVKNSKILSDKDAQTFTEQFIKDQMKTGWGINKQNQLLFIWDAVYGQILNNKQLYTGEDGNQTRLNEFEKVMEKAEACGKKYKEGFKAYMKQRSAEARQQSAEAGQQSAEAKRKTINENITTIKGFIKDIRDGLAKLEAKKKDENVSAETEKGIIDFSKREKEIIAKFDVLNKSIQNNKKEELDQQLSSSNQLVSESAKLVSAISKQQSAEAQQRSAEARQGSTLLTYYGLCQAINFYTMRNAATEIEIKESLEYFKHVNENCKKYKINYQSLLPLEVQRYCGFNPTGNQQNSLTCDKAMVQILNIVLQEIVKLYNIYQKAPQAKRKIEDITFSIDACKKHNINYKSKLSPEVRRFFGVE